MKRVLITGASGFVGRPLVAALAQQGHTVRAAVRRPLSFPSGIDVTVVTEDAGREAWRAAFTDIDVVIHLAGIAHAGAGIAAADYERINHAMTAEIAAAATERGVERLIFISSIRAQSGPAADLTLTEADTPHPTDPYGRSKLAAEAAIKDSGVPFTIFRPVLIYGPGVKGNLAALIRLAASPWPLPLAAFANRRSLLALDNLIDAIRFAIETPATTGETYVIADPTPLTLADIVTTLRDALGRPRRLFPVPPDVLRFALRSLGRGDMWDRIGGSLIVDCAKLKAAGWRPVIDAPAGLAAMVRADAARQGSRR